MNLALTYASRTQHVRLARHISELIQQKSMEELSDDDDFENGIGQFDNDWTNQNAESDVADDVTYAKSRSHSLNKKSDLISKSSGKKFNLSSKSSLSSTDRRSKFNHYMDKVKRGKFLSSTASRSKSDEFEDESSREKNLEQKDDNSIDCDYDNEGTESTADDVRGGGGNYDETKELFSDSEQDAVRDDDDADGDRVEERGSDDGMEDDFSLTPTRDAGGFSSSSGMKRANPFKVSYLLTLMQ